MVYEREGERGGRESTGEHSEESTHQLRERRGLRSPCTATGKHDRWVGGAVSGQSGFGISLVPWISTSQTQNGKQGKRVREAGPHVR